jgi:hypothetical protein
MDRELSRLYDQHTPKLNPDLAGGLAQKHMQEGEAWVDSVYRAVARGFPPNFIYVRGERCTPQQEFDEATRKKNNKRMFDVARSDIYMMKYIFRHTDKNGKVEEINRYMYLPFVSDAGVIYLGGSRFVISPILADRVISKGEDSIFVKLIRAKLTFQREQQHFLANDVTGRDFRETVHVAWSLVYNKNQKMQKLKPVIKANTTLVHYLLCKFGFAEMFSKFGNCTPIVGDATTISEAEYPPSDWVICKTNTHTRPARTYTLKSYTPTTIRLAIRREEYTPMVKNLVCGFFYIVDHFPSRVQPKYLGTVEAPKPRERALWMVLMGHLLFSSNINEGKLEDDIAEHIRSLDEYIDEVMKLKFKDIGMPIDDIYQLFGIVLENFQEWILAARDHVSSMYDKELSVLYYVLDEITKQINKFYFKLKAASKKDLNTKEITTMMNQTLRTGLVYSITKKHGEVSTISCPGDNKAFKTTAQLVPQTSSSRQTGRKDNAAISDPTKKIHISVCEVGGYANLPKSDPSGHARLNPHLRTDAKGVVLRDPALIELLDSTQAKLKGAIPSHQLGGVLH